MKKILNTLLFLVTAFSLVASEAMPADSACSRDKFKAKELILPGALIGVGTFGVYNGWIRGINHDVRRGLHGSHSVKIDNYLQFVPQLGTFGLGLLGVKARSDLRDRALMTVTSFVLVEAVVQPVKRIVGFGRPDGSDNHSFPSGHTALAFMGAERLRIEYGNWWGLAGYAVAGTVAYLRIYNDRHWLTDVVAGAGIGILATRASYWLLPFEKKLLGLDRRKKSETVVAMPYVDPVGRGAGAALCVLF